MGILDWIVICGIKILESFRLFRGNIGVWRLSREHNTNKVSTSSAWGLVGEKMEAKCEQSFDRIEAKLIGRGGILQRFFHGELNYFRA